MKHRYLLTASMGLLSRVLVVLVGMGAIGPIEALAQNRVTRESTIKEALEFVQASFQSCGLNRYSGELGKLPQGEAMTGTRWLNTIFAFGDTTLIFEEDTHQWNNRPGYSVRKIEVHYTSRATAQLSELSPDVKIDGPRVILECTVSECWDYRVMKHWQKETNADGSEKVESLPKLGEKWPSRTQIYTLCSAVMAPRVGKALSDAISAAGGKRSKY